MFESTIAVSLFAENVYTVLKAQLIAYRYSVKFSLFVKYRVVIIVTANWLVKRAGLH